MANEVELKLLVPPDESERLFHHPVFETVARRELPPQQLLSVYYDTPDLDLKRHRIALRLRHVDGRWIQTVKTEGKVAGGLHERPEWENETVEGTPDLAAISAPTVREFFLAEKIRNTLRPVFVTEFVRTSSLLEFANGEVIELSLDQGEIRAEGKQVPLCEVELELKAGNAARLFELALALQETLALKLENISKAERGYRLLVPVALVPVKARAIELPPDLPVSAALVDILRSELMHLQANEEGVLREEDPEFVHQMRVALRRIRSALSVFSALVPREKSESIRAELRWLTGEFDAVRNWDVFTLDTLPPILAAFPDHQELVSLKMKSEGLRQQQTQRAREAITSSRYQRLLLNLGAWLSLQSWRDTDTPDGGEGEEKISSFATRVLKKWRRRLKKKGKDVTTSSPEEQHQVRIVAKKLRYAAEFFASLYPQKQKHLRRYLETLAEVQEILGSLNDAATARLLLSEVVKTIEEFPQSQAQSLVLGWTGGKSQAQLKDLERVWSNFVEQKIFW
ncbi:MAG: inorganic triphosphatase [Deltaproteobacteria bacterium]|nr:inorganic triphosphatase [Deltaproteobacteria bacterium]